MADEFTRAQLKDCCKAAPENYVEAWRLAAFALKQMDRAERAEVQILTGGVAVMIEQEAQLTAARKVVEAGRKHGDLCDHCEGLNATIREYDRVVKGEE